MSARILVLDIETAPNLGYIWGLWNQNIGLNQIKQSGQMLSFAARWHGERPIQFHSDYNFDTGELDGHAAMVAAAWDLLDEADIVVHFNGVSFDVPHMRREWIKAGFTPPSPFKQVDLLQTARKQFMFVSNKLDYIVNDLGIGEKVKHSGFELWTGCLAGDLKAWTKMRRYNIGDVRLTDELYDRLLPWITTHPHVGLYSADPSKNVCGRCGGARVQKRGTTTTALSVFQLLWCRDCGGWSRVSKRTVGVDVRPTA